MPRLIAGSEWYEAVSPTAMYEADFQNLVAQAAPAIFANFYVADFKIVVESIDGTAKADLALIDQSYRAWWVVEIELLSHSLEGHVIPQVRRLAQAAYGVDAAEYLARANTHLDPEKLRDMMKGAQPCVLVVVNGPCPEWKAPLAAFDARVAVVEVYRSQRNTLVLRLNGYYPEYATRLISHCRVDRTLLRLVVVDSPASLPAPPGGILEIEFAGGLTRWRRVDIADRVYLNPVGPNPLTVRRHYSLVKTDEGLLRFTDDEMEV